jgi:hypothetical protein
VAIFSGASWGVTVSMWAKLRWSRSLKRDSRACKNTSKLRARAAQVTAPRGTEDWKIWRIDFTRAFRLHKELKSTADLTHCDRQLFAKLKVLNQDELTEKTKHYLTKDEVKAVMARRDKTVEQFQKLISEKGENEVLY